MLLFVSVVSYSKNKTCCSAQGFRSLSGQHFIIINKMHFSPFILLFIFFLNSFHADSIINPAIVMMLIFLASIAHIPLITRLKTMKMTVNHLLSC